jgi:hypothetical protein
MAAGSFLSFLFLKLTKKLPQTEEQSEVEIEHYD